MRLFSFLDVTKQSRLWRKPPTKGVGRVVYLYMMNFTKLVKLNLLFILFALPVVTLPGALAALAKISLKIVKEEPYFLFSDFWDAFKGEFKRASIFFWIHTLVLAMAIFAIYYYIGQRNDMVLSVVPLIISIVFTCFLILVGFYAYPMIVSLDLPMKAIVKNALLLSMLCVKRNVLLLIGTALMGCLILLFMPVSILVVILLMFSLMSLVVCYNVQLSLEKYIIKNESGRSFDGQKVKW